MLESYISPFLLGYVNKYIKNLKPEDLQLSLWGGDLVLNKLDLRLDVLEQELNLPLTFISGHIHELRIHVPWTRLGYEPVVVTINTIECALKLRDAGYDEHDSASSKSSVQSKSKPDSTSQAKLKYEKQDRDLPPGYVQSLMNRVINNVTLVIKNLVLKYVEEDIVLSVNVKSAESFAVNANWLAAFTELSLPELVLRRVCEFSDLTVCLDKRNASGKIEVYQEPVAYRCAVTLRMHMTYTSLNAKRPGTIKINVNCKEVDMSLSDTQLPMFIRLLQLLMALYYGTLDQGNKVVEPDDQTTVTDTSKTETTKTETSKMEGPAMDSEGWASWAWSYVPDILYYDEEEEGGTRKREMRRDPILSVGLYCDKARITFKLSKEISTDHPVYSTPSPKLKTYPLLRMELSGSAIEVLMRGELFFVHQMGFSHITASIMGDCVCGLAEDGDGASPRLLHQDTPFLQCGSPDYNHKYTNYLTNSLFDPNCPENKQQRAPFILDWDQHQDTYSEALATQRFGAVWTDYLFLAERIGNRNASDSSSRSSHHSADDSDPIFDMKETSSKQFLFSPAKVVIGSAIIHRLQKFHQCAVDHEYEPYSTPRPEIVDDNRPSATPDQISTLEEWVPSRSSHITLLNLQVLFSSAQHPFYGSAKHKETRKDSMIPDASLVPTLCLQIDRIDIQSTEPMYARKLIKPVSKLPPTDCSSKLMHHCYTHKYYKIFGCQFGLTYVDPGSDLPPPVLPIMPSWSAAVYHKVLVLPVYWNENNLVHSEVMLELPGLSLNATKAQCLLMMHIYNTWSSKQPQIVVSRLAGTSLLEDVFKPSVKAFPSGQPVLQASIYSLEVRLSQTNAVQAISGTLSQAQLIMQALDQGRATDTPLFHGPVETTNLHQYKSLMKQQSGVSQIDTVDLLTFTLQIPRISDVEKTVGESCGVFLLDIQGTALCVDPIIYTWLLYQPRGQVRSKVIEEASSRRSKSSVAKHNSSQGSSSAQMKTNLQDNMKASQPLQQQPSSLTQRDREPAGYQLHGMDSKIEGDKSKTEERSLLEKLWMVLKHLTVQVEIQSCFVALPTDHLNFAPDVTSIPECIRQSMLDRSSGEMVVLSLPTLKAQSLSHQKILALQEIPLERKDLPPYTGEKLPWSVKASNLSMYTIHTDHGPYYLLKPLVLSATVGVTSNFGHGALQSPTLGLCVHADMQEVMMACSKPQVALVVKLLNQALKNQSKLIEVFTHEQRPHTTQTTHIPPNQQSPSKRAPKVLSSVASSGQPENQDVIALSASSLTDGTGVAPPDKDGGNNDALKLSLWLQWTLQKCCVSLYGGAPPMKISCEVEDLTTSFDLQGDYSKVTCKVGSINVNHYTKKDKSWGRGPFRGVVFSCNDTITHNTRILGLQPTSQSAPRPFNPFAVSHAAKPGDSKSHGFLSATWTRAQGQSVAQKMSSKQAEASKKADAEMAPPTPRFIHEIVVSVQPFDILVWCPLVVSVLDIFKTDSFINVRALDSPDMPEFQAKPRLARLQSQQTLSTASVLSPSDSYPRSSTASQKSTSPVRQEWLSSRSLPLVYLDCKEIRVFAPTKESSTVKEAELTGIKTDEDEIDVTMVTQDTFLFQVNSVCLVPHADNPLQRLILKKEIFRRAVQAGQTQTPGSEVEDRQYQLDVNNLSMSVALWEQIETSCDQGKIGVNGVGVQNPALEWNTEKLSPAPKEVCLLPIVVGIDMRFVAAPAIVIDKSFGGSDKKKTTPVMVCGHSVEMDFTSDMTFYLSTGQVCLLQTLAQENFLSLMKLAPLHSTEPSAGDKEHAPRRTPASQTGNPITQSHDKHAGTHRHQTITRSSMKKPTQLEDSGLGSEDSTQMGGVRLQKLKVKMHEIPIPKVESSSAQGQKSKKVSKSSGFTPVDALVTAGKVSMFLYTRQISVAKNTRTEQEEEPCNRLETIKEQSVELQPFLFVTVMQPAAVLSLGHQQQRAQVTIYDFTVDGASLKHVAQDIPSTQLLPSPGDYTVSWFETCPGEPNSKTGVRPALFTFAVTNCLSNQADAKLAIGRPIKVSLSLSKVDQALDFMKALVQPKTTQISMAPIAQSEATLPRTTVIIPVLPRQPTTRKTKPSSSQSGHRDALDVLTRIKSVSVQMTEFVVAMATVQDSDYPHVVCSFSECQGALDLQNDDGIISEMQARLAFQQLLLKTSIGRKTRPLIGPFNLTLTGNSQWAAPGGHQTLDRSSVKRMTAGVNLGHVTVFLGQEHLNCLSSMQCHVAEYADKYKQKENQGQSSKRRPSSHQQPLSSLLAPSSTVISQQPDRHYKDDLRAGTFHYVTDSDGIGLQPKANEIVFSSPTQEHNVKGHWGAMTWSYPEPRILTHVSVTPIPLHQAGAAESNATAEEEVPCTLEYWDDLRQGFCIYKQLYVSEVHSYHLTLPSANEKACRQAVSSLWRVVLNAVVQNSDDEPLSRKNHPGLIVSPTALAASMRVDSCFSAQLLPELSLGFKMECMEVRLAHHTDALGKGRPKWLEPFVLDGLSPADQEMMVLRLRSSDMFINHWRASQANTNVQMSTTLQCDLMTYRNLTMSTLLHPMGVTATVDSTWGQGVEGHVDMESVKIIVGQETVHTLNMALQAIKQANEADQERLLFCSYAVCNDTDETLRFGQVHTDESMVLASRKVHEYSWRTHKHHRQRLHVCIEGWRNWRWSEPFSLDHEGTIVRTLQHQEQTAALFIKIKKISPLQKQVIFCGQHIFTNMLSLDLEVQLIRLARIGSQVIDTKHFQNLSAKSSLPSLTCSSNDITGVRLRLDKDGCDWSEQFAISGEMSREQSILKVSNQDGVFHYMWCRIFTEEIQGNVQQLVLLSPLFIIRSHLPWPLTMNVEIGKQHDQKVIEVEGQASDQSLYQFAPDTWHNLTFQLSHDAEISSPSIPINTDMIDDLILGSPSVVDDTSPVSIETVFKCCQPLDMTMAWPYNHLDYNSAKSFTGSLRHTELPPSKQSTEGCPQEPPIGSVHQPNTDLQVSITQPCPFLNTIVVDVLPWCMIVNETDLDIDILEQGCQPVCVQKQQVTAPQRFKTAFHLQLGKAKYTTSTKSNPIHLVAASVPSTGHDPSTLTLISEGFIHVCLSVQRMGLAQNRVVRLTVRSTVKHNIRVITILPQFVLRNKCKKSIRMRSLDVTSTNKLPLQESSLHEVMVPSATTQETHIPITQWNVLPTSQPITAEQESVSQYFSLSSELTSQNAGIKEAANQEQTHWSRWVLVDISRPRLPVAVPIHQVYSQASPKATSATVTMATQPLVVILAEQEGVTYLTLDEDSMTRVTVSNTCPYPIHFGQTPFDITEKLEVLEQRSPVPSIPLVLPHCLVHYDLQRPSTSSTPDSEPQPFLPSIHLCLGSFLGVAICLEDSKGEQKLPKEERKGKYSWSEAIQLATDHQERSEIVSVAGVGYVLLSSHCVGTQLQVSIDPLSMDGSKTGGSSGIQPSMELPRSSVPNSLLAVEMGDADQGISALSLEKITVPINPLQYRFRLSAESVVVMVMDEVTDLVQTSEMLRVTVDDVQLLSFPCVEDGNKSPVQQQKLQVSAQACQVDNQLFKVSGSHDFAVILCSQPDSFKSGEDEVPHDAPIKNRAAFYSKHHAFVALTLLESCTTGSFKLASVEVEAKPLELFIEDILMYDLLVKIQTFVPAKSHDQCQPITRQSFPTKVRVASRALKDPISMRQFLIQPVRLLASIHASLKLFIAVDSTPLSFKQFDSGPVFATTRQLVQALTVHYTSGALFKAGWVLGSLEILGNPAGLLRNVRSGLTDSFLLPYEGLTRGPAAFVAGVTSGTSSLLKHLSAGTLTSITMFASSVSRNLDRLTLDEDHIARREKQRRRVPDRMTDGLLQGLSGFGISLLGAIGGIADQPIKSFYQAPAISSRTQKATGVIRGVGKGLMGVVIKPLGGAAELVSQTGQGILHSAGLVETRTPRGDCVALLSAMAKNSRLKYTWKMLQPLPNSDILIHCDITTITFHGLQRGGCLLLTPEVLFVVSSSEDTQQQVFPIFELECTPVAGSTEGVCVTVKSPISPSVLKKEETSSRVADFVGGIATRPCDPLDIDPLVSSDTQSDVSSLPGGHTVDDTRGTTSYQYFLQQACYRDTFLSLFQQAKNKLLGKGFCYDETNNTGFSRFKMWHTSTKMQLEGL